MPHFLASFSGVTDEGSKGPDRFDGKNLVFSDIDLAGEILNSMQINILSSAPSPTTNPSPSTQKTSESSSSFCFNKSNKKKKEIMKNGMISCVKFFHGNSSTK